MEYLSVVSAQRLYPKNAAYMARTDLEQTRMLGFTAYNLDAVTTLLMGLLNGHPTIRHRSGATESILALLERAGLKVSEDMRVYEHAEEAERHADRLIEEGYRLFWPYPLREQRFPIESHLVSPNTWKHLNAKDALDQIVPRQNLAPRSICALEGLAEHSFVRPMFLKAGGKAATGWGYAVRYCPDRAQWVNALESFRSLGVQHVIVEEAISVHTCWCVALVVEAARTSYMGAAEQVFAAPGKQSGSVVDEAKPFPREGAELAVTVGEAARKAGFLGLAGLDIGLTSDNSIVVFDPNFRFNSSSSQVLLHDAAARRGGFTASHSVNLTTSLCFSEIARRVREAIDDGWFVPTRFLDGALLPAANGRSACTGFVLGTNRGEAFVRHQKLQLMLGS